ncbi:MAG: 16S rRNA (guanine(527)-N(7))-methyltransferase RsmG [Magnetococcales bacterium]|nr:16S rRNA (guanine(527)-N(7))-methyltransferase RsmG [Magnetococcales bacterium]
MTIPYSTADWDRCFTSFHALLGRLPSPTEQNRLQQFTFHLLEWNEKFNLIGPSARTSLLDRHILDSTTLLPLLPSTVKIADMGSGAGFPGLILAILSDGSSSFHLYESSQKKAGFLNFIATELQLNDYVTIFPERVEQARQANQYGCVTSRAVASLETLAKMAKYLLRPQGISLAMKGRGVQEELKGFLTTRIAKSFSAPQVIPAGEGVVVRMHLVSRETRPRT